MAFVLRNSDDEFEKYRKKRDRERGAEEAAYDTGTQADVKAAAAQPRAEAKPAGSGEVKPVGSFRGFLCSAFGILGLVAFISVFAMAFLLMPVLENNGLEWLLIADFGAAFFFVGLAVWSGGAGLFPLLFVLVGGAIMGVAILFGLGNDGLRDAIIERGIPFLAGLAFTGAGVGMIIVPRVIYKKRKEQYSVPVDAKIIRKDLRTIHDSDGHRSSCYYLSYEYYYNGKAYKYQSNIGRSPERREPGEYSRLWLDPANPGKVWEGDSFADAILTILGVAFLGAGCFVIAMALGISIGIV